MYWFIAKHVLLVQSKKFKKHNLKNKYLNQCVQPMEFVCIDLIGEFYPPSSKGNRYALTAVCMLTVLLSVFLSKLKQQKKSSQPGEIIFLSCLVSVGSYFQTMGQNLKMIYSHRVAEQLRVERKIYTHPYRPQSNGHIEGFHNFLKSMFI